MKVYTFQLAQHRQVKAMNIPALDTTVKSGIKTFAPTWEMVKQIKAGQMTERVYTALYWHRMHRSMREAPHVWEKLLGANEVALGCYCPAGKFCHRRVLVDFIEHLCRERGIAFERMGEIGKRGENNE